MRLEKIKALHDDNCSMGWPITERAQNDRIRFALAIEQAARREALESALGVCAAVMTDSMNKDGEAACEACMVAIRALMGEEK